MKTIPEVSSDWSSLNKLVNGGILQKIFFTALRLRVFDHLDHATAEEVAARLECHPRNTGLILDTLAGMDLIGKKEGRYFHTKQSAEYLVSDAPGYLGAYLLHVGSFHEQFPVSMEDLVRQGPPATMPNMANESMWAESARLSAAYQYSGEAQYIAQLVSRLAEFPAMSRMLDLGGGAGFFCMAIVAAHPSMHGVVFEQPAVAEVTKQFIRDDGLDGRINVLSGDYTSDDLQGPYDLIFASSTLNFHKHNFDKLFRKLHDALLPGGVFMTHQDGLRAERTQPVGILSEFLVPQMMGADFGIDQGEIADAMLGAGFQSVRSFTKLSSAGEMDVNIGRKARR